MMKNVTSVVKMPRFKYFLHDLLIVLKQVIKVSMSQFLLCSGANNTAFLMQLVYGLNKIK